MGPTDFIIRGKGDNGEFDRRYRGIVQDWHGGLIWLRHVHVVSA